MYGLIGKKLSHSFSADFFNRKFRREGIDDIYRLFPIENIDLLPSLIAENIELKGLNVTIPYKEEVLKFLNFLSPEVKEIGAVNVIKIEKFNPSFFDSTSFLPNSLTGNHDKTLIGYNTDYIGFRDSLIPLLNKDISNALILGTGGASKAVEYALKELGINSLKVSRYPTPGELGYEELDRKKIEENTLIVNTTPLGMCPDIDTTPPIPYSFLTPNHICYDLVYNPSETKFLKLCRERGATEKNGLEMLQLQAVAAWQIWNGGK